MTRSNATNAIAAVSKAAFKNGLQAAGFRRQGNHLLRLSNELINGIHFQASRGFATPLGRFTINLVVTSESLYRYWIDQPLPANPTTGLFPVQHRIGLLLPDKKGWWEVGDNPNLEELANEVTAVILRYGLPFFDHFASPTLFLDWLRSGKAAPGATGPQSDLVHAMLAKDAGFEDEARRVLHKAFNEAKSSGFRATILLIAKRLEISGVAE
jgi:hypothetical protein